jgi:NAD(P)H dehydrogenase (quinone)
MTILITGAAGNLGSEVLDFLCRWNDPSTVIATSRNPANESKFKTRGIQFHLADFDKQETLKSAFTGVDKLMIISTDTFDTETRVRSQNRAIDAAIAANVKHVYYTSTACGGYTNKSDVYIQQGHFQTENYLKKSA